MENVVINFFLHQEANNIYFSGMADYKEKLENILVLIHNNLVINILVEKILRFAFLCYIKVFNHFITFILKSQNNEKSLH